MKPNLIILFIVMLSLNVYSGPRPIWFESGNIGEMTLEKNSGVVVSEQNLEIKFFEKEKEIYGRFKVEYHLKNISRIEVPKKLGGLFCSNKVHSVIISYNDKPITQDFSEKDITQNDTTVEKEANDTTVEKEANDTTVEKEANDTTVEKEANGYYSRLFAERTDLGDDYNLYPFSVFALDSVQYFEITFNPSKTNVLVIEGEIKPQMLPRDVYMLNPIASRHFLLGNDKPGLNYAFLNYLSLPTKQWEYIEKINYKVTVPEKWDISSTIFSAGYLGMSREMHEYLFWDSTLHKIESNCDGSAPSTTKQINNKSIFSGTLCGDSLPHAIRFGLQRRPLIDFFIGGPKIGFGKNHRSENFALRLGWESGFEIGEIGIMTALEYESDFRNENTAVFSVYPMTPAFMVLPVTIGGGVGLPYDINNKRLGLRLRYEFSGMLLGISGNHDYFPETNEWRFSLFGEFTF